LYDRRHGRGRRGYLSQPRLHRSGSRDARHARRSRRFAHRRTYPRRRASSRAAHGFCNCDRRARHRNDLRRNFWTFLERTAMEASLEQPDRRIDEIMGLLLRGGVILAAAVVFIGGVIYLSRHAIPATDYRFFTGEPANFTTIRGIVASALSHSGRGLIQFG